MAAIIVNIIDTFDQWRKKTNDISLVMGDFSSLKPSESSLVRAINTNYTNIGSLETLSTDEISNLVGAINEVDNHTDINTINIGDLNDLYTIDKSSVVNAIDEVINNIGDLTSLTTDDKTSIILAINEVDSHTDNNESNIGELNTLTTDFVNDLVGAINEVDSHTDTNESNIGDMIFDGSESTLTDAINEAYNNTLVIGNLPSLTTDDKTYIVSAINEIDANTNTNESNIGTMDTLETLDKTSLVNAINEVSGDVIVMALLLG